MLSCLVLILVVNCKISQIVSQISDRKSIHYCQILFTESGNIEENL